MSTDYRKDIDGLRSFAIIPVLFFHSGFGLFSGGYVGVDVFFAISGFLISSILIREIEKGTFSFKRFFMRRVRRLMPMAIFTYLFVIILFSFTYPVMHFKDVAEAALSSLTFVSNIYFWQQGGYFSPNLEMNPLLHTWSLSVEEQFYLTFPLFLYLLFKLTANRFYHLAVLIMVVIFSILLAVFYAPTYHSFAAFYLLPPRMYELGVGTILAFLVNAYPDSKYRNIPLMKEAGLVLVLLPVFLFDEETRFPSYNALLPVLGAGLVMYSNRESGIADKILRIRSLVLIGLISYSLYLWHWPLIVFKNWLMGGDSSLTLDIGVIVLSTILAYLTYRYIETPFRIRKKMPDMRLVKIVSPSFVAIGGLCLGGIYFGNGYLVDPAGEISRLYSEATAAEPYRKCTDQIRHSKDFSYCELKTSNSNEDTKKVFLWGDSHGSAFVPVIENMDVTHTVRFANTTGCPPVTNIKRVDFSQSCPRVNKLVFEHLLTEGYDLVILVAAYNNYLNSGLVGGVDTNQVEGVESSINDFERELAAMLNKLEDAGIPFLLVAQPPKFENSIPDEYVRAKTLGLKYEGETISVETYKNQSKRFKSVIASKWHDRVVDLADYYCPDGVCSAIRDGQILYKDSHHVSNKFAEALSVPFNSVYQKALGIP